VNIIKFGYPVTTFTANMPFAGSEQYIFTFDNGYGASVVRGAHTYGGSSGLWEVAVLNCNGNIDYSTPITDDVLGWQNDEGVAEVLASIAALPSFDLASK
jgi:hypothetical protein